jgi:TonB-linked SusC/RagA family outer membrane protein
MKKKYAILLLFFVGMLASYSQEIIVKGKVSDSYGNSLPGVNVLVKGTKNGSSTGGDGTYSIKAPNGAVLEFTFIGFETKNVKITGPSVNVVLSESSQSLKEVVVTGSLGIKRSKSSLGYAEQTVDGKDIEQTQRSNFINSLQGRVAGLSVTSTSGAPGASAAVTLRGVGSLSGNNSPLYIVDGLPVSNQTLNQGLLISDAPNRNQDYTNRGADINPDDIESVTVLKGPEAAALYGIEAGNGAIIITTKKGKSGVGKVEFSSNTRMEEVYRFADTQKVYQRGTNGLNSTVNTQSFGERYAPGTKLYDNVSNFFETGITQQNNLTFTGGTDDLTYRLSIADLKQTGVVPTTAYDRLNITLSGSAKIGKKFKSDASFLYSKSNNIKASKGGGSFLNNLYLWPANDDSRNYLQADGVTRRRITDLSVASEIDNPYWEVYKNPAQDRTNRMVSNIGLVYDPASWLSITGRAGWDVTAQEGFRATHPQSNAGLSTGGFIENYVANSTNTNTNIFAQARKSFGKFNAKLIVGNAINYNYQTVNSTSGSKFLEQNFLSINNTDPTTQRSQQRIIRKKVIGFYSEATFDYDKILALTLTGRKDWTSTLPYGDNDFFYPSASLAFNFANIGSLRDSNWLTVGKLRASYSQVGKDASPYDILSNFQPQLTTGAGFAYGVTGANSDLKPEFKKSYEIGTELKFFKNRLGLDVAVYRQETEDQIIRNLRLSYGTGFVVSSFNFGTTRVEGIEATFTAIPIQTDNFEWNMMLNFTKTDSELLSLPSTLPEYYVSDTWLYANVRAGARVGSPLTSLTGGNYLFNTAGQPLISGSNGQPLYNNTFPIIGDRNPDFVIGFENKFNYKEFSLSFLLDIRKGGDVYNGTELLLYANGLSTRTLDRETPRVLNGIVRDGLENSATPTQNNIQVTPYYQQEYYSTNYVEADFIEKDVNWLRCRDITLSYRLPSRFFEKVTFFRSIGINFTVTDAFMFTNYTGADPAVNGLNASTGGAGGAGMDYGVLSTPRGFNFNMKFGF